MYQAELDHLQPQTLPPAHHCAYECNTPAVCYTDYEPNYNPSHLLNNIIVGRANATDSLATDWVRVSRGSRDARLNYKDIKIVYEVSYRCYLLLSCVCVPVSLFFLTSLTIFSKDLIESSRPPALSPRHFDSIALITDYRNEHDAVPEGECQQHGLLTGVWVQCEREHGARPFLLRLQRYL